MHSVLASVGSFCNWVLYIIGRTNTIFFSQDKHPAHEIEDCFFISLILVAMARFTLAAAILLTENIASGYLVSPSGTAFPGASTSCSEWVAYTDGLTCAYIEATYGITEAQFLDWVS